MASIRIRNEMVGSMTSLLIWNGRIPPRNHAKSQHLWLCCAMVGEKEMMLSVSIWRFHEGNYYISLHRAWHGRVRERSFQPLTKNRLWIRSLTPLSVIINVLFCIVMYCQWQLVEVSLKRHLWRAIFKKSAITAGCCTIFYGTRYKLQFFTGVSQFFFILMRLFFKKHALSFIYKLSFWSVMQIFGNVYIESS